MFNRYPAAKRQKAFELKQAHQEVERAKARAKWRKLQDPKLLLDTMLRCSDLFADSLREISPHSNLVIAPVGTAHASKAVHKNKVGNPEGEAIVQELYDALDKDSDKNPVSVLECRIGLTSKWR